jgi:hypothetical protein
MAKWAAEVDRSEANGFSARQEGVSIAGLGTLLPRACTTGWPQLAKADDAPVWPVDRGTRTRRRRPAAGDGSIETTPPIAPRKPTSSPAPGDRKALRTFHWASGPEPRCHKLSTGALLAPAR